MSTDKLSAEEYLILKQSLDEITPSEQEPVTYTGNGTAGREADVRPTGFVFQMPPQREWVGLSDDEVWDAYEKGMYEEMWFARAIEAKLKEKNGG